MKTRIDENENCANLKRYKMSKKIYLDLDIILLWSAASIIFIIFPILKDNILRSILAIPTVLFIPGYVLVSTLFPKNNIVIIERIALSFGLSIAILPLFGLILNFTYGIKLFPILITVYLYTVIMNFIARYQRRKLPEEDRFSINFNIVDIKESIKPRNKTDMVLTIILFLAIIIAIGMMVYIISVPKTGEKFTEFYILNNQTSLKLDSPTTFLLGVSNHEYAYINYTVQTVLNKNVLNSENIILGNNEILEKNITFVPNKQGINQKLEFLLFKEDNTEPYRKLHLWVNVV